jgi:hypothetical protein
VKVSRGKSDSRLLLGVCVVAAIGAAGCGGGGTETVTQVVGTRTNAEPLTKPEYIAQADEICGETRPKTDALIDQANDAIDRSDYEQAADLLDRTIEIARPAEERLAALPKPSGDEEILNRLDDSRDQGIALIERLSDAIRNNDSARFESLTAEITSVDDEGDGISTGYGLKVCGQD